jgi:hypothetical protein
MSDERVMRAEVSNKSGAIGRNGAEKEKCGSLRPVALESRAV